MDLIRFVLVGILWAILWIYSLYPRRNTKRTIRTRTWQYGILMWAAYIIVIITAYKVPSVRDYFAFYGISNPTVSRSIFGYLGILLCVAGIAFAIRARAYLGSNWGQPMSVGENPGLITSGPYTLIRHPIYSGMGLALFGSALFLGGLWFFVVFLFSCGFVLVSAKREEQLLTKEFPGEYLNTRSGRRRSFRSCGN